MAGTIAFDIDDNVEEMLEQLRARTGNKDMGSLLRHALLMFDVLSDLMKDGGVVLLISKDGETREVEIADGTTRLPIIDKQRDLMKEAMAKQAVEVLNELLKLDPDCTKKLLATYFFTNEAVAAHPTIQVMNIEKRPAVGLLGIINGVIGVQPDDQTGYIAAEYADEEREQPLPLWSRLERFTITESVKKETVH
jgi:hypothetical protein